MLMKTCDICFEEKKLFGVKCSTCRNDCCINCEIQLKQCPFCRRSSPTWIEKIGVINGEQLEFYLEKFIVLDKEKRDRALYLENLFYDAWNGCKKSMDEIIDGNLSDDDLIEILNCAKVSIYNMINSHPRNRTHILHNKYTSDKSEIEISRNIHNDIEIIRDIFKFIEILYYKIEIQTDFSIDTDELENLIHDILIVTNLIEVVHGVEIKIYNEPDWFRRFRGAIDYTRIVNFYN